MIYLGIDGGGSKTTFLLADDYDHQLYRTETGPSNWNSVGPEAARASILRGIGDLPAEPVAVCGGFAGAGRAEGAAFYRSVLQAALPDAKVTVVSDAIVAYAGAIGNEPGVLLIGGTGSIAIGRSPEGSMIRAGGWGSQFGDEGSGFWIGREAIRTALRSVDAGGSQAFAARIAAALGLNQIGDVVSAWSQGDIGVPEIAGIFPELLAIYPLEPVKRILTEAALHLRTLVETVESRIGAPGCRKSVVGSVARHPLIRGLIGLPLDEPKQSPEWGAILLAREHGRNTFQAL
jgi:glucosamine kinase